MSNIVVFGATGYAGGNITAELLARGHTVTGVARDASKLEQKDGLTAVSGSIHDPEFLGRITSPVDVIVVALPAREIDGERLLDAIPGVLDAASSAGARLGVVGGASSLRVSEDGPQLFDTPDFPEGAKPEAGPHRDVLELMRADERGVDWFYLSPAASFGSWVPGERTGTFRLGGDVLLTDEAGESYVSGADYAIAFVDEIETPAHRRERFSVAY